MFLSQYPEPLSSVPPPPRCCQLRWALLFSGPGESSLDPRDKRKNCYTDSILPRGWRVLGEEGGCGAGRVLRTEIVDDTRCIKVQQQLFQRGRRAAPHVCLGERGQVVHGAVQNAGAPACRVVPGVSLYERKTEEGEQASSQEQAQRASPGAAVVAGLASVEVDDPALRVCHHRGQHPAPPVAAATPPLPRKSTHSPTQTKEHHSFAEIQEALPPHASLAACRQLTSRAPDAHSRLPCTRQAQVALPTQH
jgi:hypothetical protein